MFGTIFWQGKARVLPRALHFPLWFGLSTVTIQPPITVAFIVWFCRFTQGEYRLLLRCSTFHTELLTNKSERRKVINVEHWEVWGWERCFSCLFCSMNDFNEWNSNRHDIKPISERGILHVTPESHMSHDWGCWIVRRLLLKQQQWCGGQDRFLFTY